MKMNKVHAVLLIGVAGYLFGPEVGQAVTSMVSDVEGVDKVTIMIATVAWTLPGPDKLVAKVKEYLIGKQIKKEDVE